MAFKNRYLCICVLPLFLCAACLHSRTAAPSPAANKTVRVNSGSAVLRINGQINENLYLFTSYNNITKDVDYYDKPLINQGTVSKDETKYLYAGDEYTFSVLPTEVVTINIMSLDDNDVEISVFEYGKEKRHILKGTNRLGLYIAFQNR